MTDSQVSYEEDDDDVRSNGTEDTLDRLLKNYTFNFQPEIRFKWVKRVKQLTFNAAYTKPWDGSWKWRFVLKPSGEPRWASWVRKVLVVPSASVVAMGTPKLKIGALRLQFDVFYNLRDKRFGLYYRYTTKFSDGPRMSSKYTYQPTKGVTLRAKHYINWVPPTVSGHIGNDKDVDDDAEDIDVGGKFHMDIDQLDFKFELP